MRSLFPVILLCSALAHAQKAPLAYDALTPYSVESPLRETHADGVPKDPLAPEASARPALPSTRPNQDLSCILSLSVSGGGSNSAAFAWGALEELNREYSRPDGRSVLGEIDYISTASGGGIAGLMLIEVLREHLFREKMPLTRDAAVLYMKSARFRGVLDQRLATNTQVLLSAIQSGNASTLLGTELRKGVVGTGSRCLESRSEAGPLAKVPKETESEFKRYVTCKLTDALTFDEIFRPAGEPAILPAFLPAVTLFESGDLLPATRAWFEKLGVEQVQFALPGKKGHVKAVGDLDYVDAVTLSMGFPGIGPVLAVTRNEGHRHGITIADGGQSDNLGLWLAYAATRNELQANPRRGAVHIVLDSAFEPATPFLEERLTGLEGVLVGRIVSNGVPLLRIARNAAKTNLDLRKRSELGEKAAIYQSVFVSAQEVLDTSEMTHHKFTNIRSGESCVKWGLPVDRDLCLKGATECVDDGDHGCSPRVRFSGVGSSLANPRRRAEDLATLGQEAMARALKGELRSALDKCFGSNASGASPGDSTQSR